VPWLCDNIVARGYLSVLAGRPGEGKSWLALGLAEGCANGSTVAGIPCQMARVLYLDGENGEREMRRRSRRLGLRHSVDFLFTEGPWDMEENLPGLCHYISSTGADFVILDGFRSLWSGDENDSRAVTHVLSTLCDVARDYDVAILMLHHMSKQGGYRGTGAIAAVPQILIEIESDGPMRELRWEKCRLGPSPYRHKFAIEGDAKSVRLISRA
jgi:putative DNA primase/helicase